MPTFVDIPPDASRVIESLRDMGYSFETAVADIVDNSIAAGAKRIDIRVDMDYQGNVEVSIADNGSGMAKEALIAAMRFGAPKQADPYRLGKFGLGLKTASTAFCRRLEVATRTSARSAAVCACWDLDDIARKDTWALELLKPPAETLQLLDATADKSAGTVVTWKKVDRFFGRRYRDPIGGHARKALDRRVAELRDHLAVTFERFLEGRAASYKGRLEITVNEVDVEPWDPFCSNEKAAESVTHEIPVEIVRGHKKEMANVTLRTVILPAQSEFSTRKAYDGARVSLAYQGIYVYRHDRLLTHGTWLKMYAVHGSHNMLRVELSFDYKLDDVFSVPVDKSDIEIDAEFAEELMQNYLHKPVQEAERRRAGALRKKQAGQKSDMHEPSNQAIQEQEGNIKQPGVKVIDAAKGSVEITNRVGKVVINLPVRSAPETEGVFIQPVDGIQDNMLFEPALLHGKQGVLLNVAHDYYRKIYLPNREVGGAILGIDSLLWALCVAETNNVTPATATAFREIRYEISKILRNLVEKLPDIGLEVDE